MDFPLKKYNEGNISFFGPDLDKYRVPQEAPVFYNPQMEFNRDCSILTIQTYQRLLNKKINICDLLSGTGVRGLRYAKEINCVRKVILNDYNKLAYKLIKKNVKYLGLKSITKVYNENADFLLTKYFRSKERFDVIDIDPFGSPTIFIDNAIRGLKRRGLLALTATDMQVLCGIRSLACLRKYGGLPLRTEYCHELAIRLLIGCVSRIAARLNYSIHPLISFAHIHYIRVFIEMEKGIEKAKADLKNMGFIYHCFECQKRKYFNLFNYNWLDICPFCNSNKIGISGPLWLGQIQDKQFIKNAIESADILKSPYLKKVVKLFSRLKEEAEMPPTYYNIHSICKKLKISPPKFVDIIYELKAMNYKVSKTHFCTVCIKTDADITTISEIIQKIIKNNNPK
ncbi:MAG: tRNA (guanine(10)-N(2))-dimethyltransferase [Candidatus Helarchaeota archaeon]